ncbi:DUF2336 domain-containing protein [Jiella avicenniae]|uniref:DUF2336 domain-containing protein n=1 Tax=Jiella avicenniae TaxID=2907202 RepID=A0A9X1P130_9HYPH|nr:DUF2336 domain-containing protein [Jiella avicenniae]MCE7028156.1 DUF2336 domain-containing protein [Jiella avicenniae]
MIVQRFAKWAREANTRERAEAATMLAEALVHGEARGADRDTIVASLTLLLDDPAPSVRLAMAKVLSAGRNVPRSLVSALAADVAPVATEIAGRSMFLSTEDLVDLAAVGSAAARRAIAGRPVVSLPVAAVIAELGEPEAALALCCNDGAAIGDTSFDHLVDRFAGDGRVREALLGRGDLPPVIRHRLMLAVRDTLAGSGLLVNLFGAKRAGVVAFAAAERGTNVLAEALSSRQMPNFGEYLRGSGAVTPSLLVRVVATGNIELFITLLASLSGRSERRVAGIVGGGKSPALRALVIECGLDEGLACLFGEAVSLWRTIARGDKALRPAAVPSLILGRLSATGASGRIPHEASMLLRRLAGEAERDAVREAAAVAA